MRDRSDHLKSSGKIFADLGLPQPEEALVKAELARRIARIIEPQRLTQAQAAQILDVDQLRISAPERGPIIWVLLGTIDEVPDLAGARPEDCGQAATALAYSRPASRLRD